jgi:hypothetical protein
VTQPYYYDRQQFGGPSKPKRRVWPWILGGALVFLVLCVGGAIAALGGGVKAVQHEQASRTADVHISSCAKTVIGTVEVSYSLTNSDTIGRTYVPEFQVKATDGTIVGQATDVTPEVGAGQSFKGKAVGTVDDSAGSKFTCVLVSA